MATPLADMEATAQEQILSMAEVQQLDPAVRNWLAFLDTPPPPLVSWLVAAVVIVTLGFRVWAMISHTRKWRADIERKREDEYWFRSVVLDPCLTEVDHFAKQCRDLINGALSDLDGALSPTQKTEVYSSLLRSYREAQNALIFALSQLSIFKEEYYRECVAFLEKLEDKIVSSMGSEVLGASGSASGLNTIKVQSTKIEVLRYLKQVHSNLF